MNGCRAMDGVFQHDSSSIAALFLREMTDTTMSMMIKTMADTKRMR